MQARLAPQRHRADEIIEVLVSTVDLNETPERLVERMGIDESVHVLIVNQTSQPTTHTPSRPTIRLISFDEKGLSRSRNRALDAALGDILLVADDDVRYPSGAFAQIRRAFSKNKRASVITFQMGTSDGTLHKSYRNRAFSHNRLSIASVSSIEIALRRQKIGTHRFDTSFGLGTEYAGGEEAIFLRDLQRAAHSICYFPARIVVHDGTSSGHQPFSAKTAAQKGAVLARLYPFLWPLIWIGFSIQKRNCYLRSIGIQRWATRSLTAAVSLSRLRPMSKRSFHLYLTALIAAYWAIELFYVTRLPFVMDEYGGAAHLIRYKSEIPYKDFQPYKTVLGYYFQLPFLLLSSNVVNSILWVKAAMATTVAGALLWAGLTLRRAFGERPVLLGLAALCFHSNFLERSAEMRVDMLTGVLGLVGLVFLINRQIAWAGFWAGVSVLVSQKGLLYIAASAAALLYCGLKEAHLQKKLTRQVLQSWAVFVVSTLLPLIVYTSVFFALAEPARMKKSAIGTSSAILNFQGYDLTSFWWQLLERNETFSLLAVVAPFYLLWSSKERAPSPQRITGVYALTCLTLGISYPHPWPYVFVLLLPSLAVGIIAACSQALTRRPTLDQRWVWLPLILLLCVKPFWLRLPRVLERDLANQRIAIQAAQSVLGSAGTYFAGVAMIRSNPQPPRLGWLDERSIAQLKDQPSVYFDALDARPPLLVIDNYRLTQIPRAVQKHIETEYKYIGYGIRTHLIKFEPQNSSVYARFEGTYRLLTSEEDDEVLIDGKKLTNGATTYLEQGAHTALSSAPAELILWSTDPSFQSIVGLPKPHLFRNVYTY